MPEFIAYGILIVVYIPCGLYCAVYLRSYWLFLFEILQQYVCCGRCLDYQVWCLYTLWLCNYLQFISQRPNIYICDLDYLLEIMGNPRIASSSLYPHNVVI